MIVCDLLPDRFNRTEETIPSDPPPGFLLDLVAALGKAVDHVRRHVADFKIAGVVLDL
jgi:hypothetical protein